VGCCLTTLIFDAEATGAQRNHANPFDHRNVMCNIGFLNAETNHTDIFKIQYDDEPFGESLRKIQSLLDSCTVLVGFNAKYDLHWLYRYGLTVPDTCYVYDTQVAFYVATHQKNKYPSLDGCAEYFGLPRKLDIVKTEYWDKGLDTDQVPYEILSEYLAQDLVVTHQLYIKLNSLEMSQAMKKLIKLENLDLKVLSNVEQNGLMINVDKCAVKSREIDERVKQIDDSLLYLAGVDWFNPSSGDHLSAFLYGGTVGIVEKVPYIFTYKDGRTAEKFRNEKVDYSFKGYFKPLAGSELAKEGFYSTSKDTLVTLSENATDEQHKVINLLLERSKLEKKKGTYYDGYRKRLDEFNWKHDLLHSNFNQCVTETGRLSSTKPNVQNIDGEVKEVIISRFK
jgi:DNA polymerase I-like protein with 3'-5' exonuclease and polymerase domains